MATTTYANLGANTAEPHRTESIKPAHNQWRLRRVKLRFTIQSSSNGARPYGPGRLSVSTGPLAECLFHQTRRDALRQMMEPGS